MVKLKHIRFNKTVKNNKNAQLLRFLLGYKSKQNNRTNKKYTFPLLGFTRKHINNRKMNIYNRNNNYITNTTIKTKINMPRLAPIETNNSTNSKKQYIKNKTFKHKKKQILNKHDSYGKDKTPIFNSYVPGSGVGASNITTRRLKKKFV